MLDDVSVDYSARETIFVPGVYIRINEDTLRVCLSNHLKRLEKKSRWTTPYAIFATIVITLITSDFHDFIVSGDTWQKNILHCWYNFSFMVYLLSFKCTKIRNCRRYN